MPGKIQRLPVSTEGRARLLEHWVRSMIESHPDAEVGARWAELAAGSLQRFCGAPEPESALEIGLPGLDAGSRECILDALEAWLQSYMGQVSDQVLAMHRELLATQMQVAELQVAAMRRDG